MINLSRHRARLVAVAATVGAVGAVSAFALSNASASTDASGNSHSLTVHQIAFGSKLHHSFKPSGTGAAVTEALAGPDDLSLLGDHIFVGFQNGVGPQGEPSTSGNLDSTVVEFTRDGAEVRQWDVKGKDDGLTADPLTGNIIATSNEDANSSLYTIAPKTGKVVHYAYNEALPHLGGTDAISIYRGQILISASAPGTTGTAPANAPAVYVVRLDATTKVATVRPLFAVNATAIAVNGSSAGSPVTLALTDPDSSEVVPASSAAFGGEFMLNSQGDQELIFTRSTRPAASLHVLSLPTSVDDSAWGTGEDGVLYSTDSSSNTLDVIKGSFGKGTMYTAVTPCNANSAPSTCPAPGYPAPYLGTVNLTTGAITKITTSGAAIQPKGMIFVPSSN